MLGTSRRDERLRTYFGLNAAPFAAVWLVLSLLLIIAATIAFAFEIRLSLHALGLAVEHMPRGEAPSGGGCQMSPVMTTPFNELLASALAPITLISGVGLLMLSMSARYNHATTRIRLLMNERLDPKLSDDERADIDEEIDFIFHRAGLLRNGELCVVLSAVVSGLMVALCVLEESTGVHADFVNSMLLVAAVGLIVLSTVFLSLEIRLSLKAIKVVVSKLPPMDEAFDDAAAARAAQAVEARHQSHVLNEARHASDGKAPHEVRKVEEKR